MDRRLERERGGCTVVGVSEMGRLGRWRGTVGGRDKYRWLMMEEWKIIRVVDGARELELGAGWHGWAGRGPWVQDPGGCWPDQSIVVNGSWLLRQCPGPPGQEFNPHRLQPAVAASLPPSSACCVGSTMYGVCHAGGPVFHGSGTGAVSSPSAAQMAHTATSHTDEADAYTALNGSATRRQH